MRTETIIMDESRKVSLTAYLQDVGAEFHFEKRPGMLVIPGGAYQHVSRREMDSVSFAYLRAGYQVFILTYGVADACKWPSPLEDYEAAMELIEKNQEAYGVDEKRIAVMGFSAGGHLAACAATMAVHKPSAAVLVYPVILEDIASVCAPSLPNPAEWVNELTCPCFLVATRDDRMVNVRNTLEMELALERHQIPFESHIYSYGHHGFASGERWVNEFACSNRLRNWMDESVGWLNEVMGELTYNGFDARKEEVFFNDNGKPYYSVDCTMDYLLQKEELIEALKPIRAAIEEGAKQTGNRLGFLVSAFRNNTLRDTMHTMKLPEEKIAAMDALLHQIPKK